VVILPQLHAPVPKLFACTNKSHGFLFEVLRYRLMLLVIACHVSDDFPVFVCTYVLGV